MFLVCLKINMHHSQNIDVEICQLWPVTSQCTKWLFPTTAICVKTVSSNETLGYIGCQWKMSSQSHRCKWDAISAVLTFCWHSLCANVMSWHYWIILVGRGPGPRPRASTHRFKANMQNLFKRDYIFALFSSTLTRRRPLQLSVKECNIHIFQQQRPKTTGNQQPIGIDIVLSEYSGRGHT